MIFGKRSEVRNQLYEKKEEIAEMALHSGENVTQYIKQQLFSMRDLEYKAFHSRLMPTISPETIIGVRTPALRKFAKEMVKYEGVETFMQDLPHEFYEENNLQGFIIEGMKDFDRCLEEVDRFLPYVDNWATCDMMRPKVFKQNPKALLPKIKEWLASGKTYTVRYGIGMLMTYFLDEHFEVKYVDEVAAVESEEYYVKMMVAWYFATALAKQRDAVIPYIETGKLEKWTHNKAIQKAIESYRITPLQKEYLRGLKHR